MLKTELFEFVNDVARGLNKPAVSKEAFVKVLSKLEVQGVVETDGEEIYVVKAVQDGADCSS